MWIGIQIDTTRIENNVGGQVEKELKKRIAQVKKIVDFDALLVWAHSSEEHCASLREICESLGIETYLWFPVLADIAHFSIPESAKVENFIGRKGWGRIGRWDKLGTYVGGREKFEFVCPNKTETIADIYNLYSNKIDQLDFDGIFLDRIRFPSAAMGFEMLYSCFCKECENMFHKEYGEKLADYKVRAKEHYIKLQKDTINIMKNANSLNQIVYPDAMRQFLNFRDTGVFRIVDMFSQHARQKGKKVGLDLFSISLAGNVSQNYAMLSKSCDWIKPMIYCHSKGPAGFALELHLFLHSIMELNPGMAEEALTGMLGEILHIELPKKVDDILEKGVSEDTVMVEMENIRQLNLSDAVTIYPGIEAMKMSGICVITEDILENYLTEIIASNAKGMILAWDLLEMPDENLAFIAERL
jgi:hypothetical protein